jgi:hypothetical protein
MTASYSPEWPIPTPAMAGAAPDARVVGARGRRVDALGLASAGVASRAVVRVAERAARAGAPGSLAPGPAGPAASAGAVASADAAATAAGAVTGFEAEAPERAAAAP